MNKYLAEIKKEAIDYLLKYDEQPNIVFIDVDIYMQIKASSEFSDSKIFGLRVMTTDQEQDFIHVSRVEN